MERALSRHPTMRGRVFTPAEIAYCDSKARPTRNPTPAGSPPGGHDQGARRLPRQAVAGHQRRAGAIEAPSIVDAQAKARADMLGITQVLVTFTHEKTNAVAFAIAVRS